MKPIAYMLCGLTGSGKTTYAKKLENKNLTRLSIDELIFKYHGRYAIDYPENKYFEYYQPVVDELNNELIKLIKDKKSVILDYGFWKRSDREVYKEMIEKNGATWKLIYFKVEKEELINRLKKRNERADANALLVTESALNDFFKRFEEPENENEIIIN